MDPLTIAITVTVLAIAAFTLGVVVHKYVISEAEAIKAHVTAEVDAAKVHFSNDVTGIRQEISTALQKAAGKL